MRIRSLGPSGIEASVVAFGGWAIGGWMWGGQDTEASIRTVQAAADAGITLFDTAPIYGFGLSERLIGKALAGRRDRVILASKCGLVTGTDKGVAKFRSDVSGPHPLGHSEVRIHLGADSIRREVELSLRRLRTDYLDLIQTHWQDPTTPIEQTMETLEQLRDEGKVRAIGCCNATVEQMAEYAACGSVDCDQESYSMLDRSAEASTLPYCEAHSIALLAYSPLARGLLSGKITAKQTFPAGDARASHPWFTTERRSAVQAMLKKIAPIAESRKLTLAQLVIAWTLEQPGVTHTLCGARTPEQACENAAAGSVELSEEERSVINAAVSALRTNTY